MIESLQKPLLIFLVISAITAQIPHAYYVFISASKLANTNARRTQAGAFCAILSIAIFTFVIMGKTELAAAGAVIELIINVYYYTEDFWKSPYGLRKKGSLERKSIMRLWRQRWIFFFISMLMPAAIYVLSELVKESL
jgi:hypothetical protein